ncbi:MAG: hypothetical protein L3K18_04020 [Thermoplasmata archaeon]|nr:hypothetical protein [Thermoplasmata archaeon]
MRRRSGPQWGAVLAIVVLSAVLLLPNPGVLTASLQHAASPGALRPAIGTHTLPPAGGGPGVPGSSSSASVGSVSTQYTLYLGNNSLLRGDSVLTPPREPRYTVYDPSTGRVYASDGSSTLWVIDPSRESVVGTLDAGQPAGALLYLPGTGELAFDSSGSVALFDPVSQRVTSTITASNASAGNDATFLYDPTTNAIWVTNSFATRIDVVNLTTGTVTTTLPVGSGFNDILSGAYDPENGRIYLAYYEAEKLEVINGRTAQFVTNVTFPSICCWMWGLTVDPKTGNVFVSIPSTVAEVSGSNNTILGTSGVGADPSNGVYDPLSGNLLIADACRSRLYILDPSNLTVLGSMGLPHEPAFLCDQWWPTEIPALGQLYISTGYSQTIDVASPTNATNATALITPGNPDAVVADAACGCYVVADSAGDRLYFVDAGTLQVAAVVGLAGSPYGLAYDARTSELWVTYSGFFGTNEVQVLNGRNGSAVASLADGQGPWGVTYDPTNGQVFVADYWGDDVRVFNGSNHTQVAVVPAGNQTTGVVYVPTDDSVYATNWQSHNLTILNASSDVGTGSIHIGGAPVPIGYDPVLNLLFVGNYANPNTTVVNVSQNAVTGSVNISNVEGFAFDAANGAAFLMNGTGTVAVVDPSNLTTSTVAVGEGTVTGIWDPGTGLIAADGGTNAVYIVNGSAPSLVSNVALLASPEQAATFAPVRLTLAALGAPPGTSYRYDGLPAGCTSQNVSVLTCYPQIPGTYVVTGTLRTPDGSAWSETARVWVVDGSRAVFSATRLAPGTTWSLNVSGGQLLRTTNSSMLSLTLPNGSYSFTATAPGYPAVHGQFGISGSPVDVPVRFTADVIDLTESGLPGLTPWWANVSGWGIVPESSPGGSSISLPNGTYSIAFGTSAPGWSAPGVQVHLGSGGARAVAQFSRPTYTVEFVTEGLTPGTAWTLNLSDGLSQSYSNPTANVSLPNGSYVYNASVAATGWNAPQGAFLVNGMPRNVTLPFVALQYPETFQSAGLPSGAAWSVRLDPGALVLESNTSVATAWVAPGTYQFVVTPPTGYGATPGNGGFTAGTGSATLNVTFAPVPVLSAPTVLGFAAAPSNGVVGSNLTFLVSAVGGAPPLTYTYSGLPAGCASADTSTLTCVPSGPGQGRAQVEVSDARGRSASDSAPYTIAEPAPAAASSGTTAPPVAPWLEAVAAGAGLGLLVLGLVSLVGRGSRSARRDRTPPTPRGDGESTSTPEISPDDGDGVASSGETPP